MAKMLGAVLGLSSLLYSIFLVLNGWYGMSQSLRVYVLIVPSIFVTILLLTLLFSLRVLGGRFYRRLRRTKVNNEYAFMDGGSTGNWLVLPIWISVGLGLYAIVEHFFGQA